MVTSGLLVLMLALIMPNYNYDFSWPLAYSSSSSWAQVLGGGLPCSFLKTEKSALILEKIPWLCSSMG